MKRIFFGLFLLIWRAGLSLAQPDWNVLGKYQQKISSETFSRLVAEVYSPDGGLVPYLSYGENMVSVFSEPNHKGAPLFELAFSRADAVVQWKKVGGDEGPLSGLKIAIDPGHIGGAWSRMEERFFLMDREKDWPVQEGALNLYVSRLLRDRLVAAGADVALVKDDFNPLTLIGPDDIFAASSHLPLPDRRFAHLPELFSLSSQLDSERKRSEQQFYRTAEITARARRVNEDIKPDLTLCVHFNATGYGDEKKLYEENGLVFFVHGNYSAAELVSDEQKFFLLKKLLEGSHKAEVALADSIAEAFVAATGLPPAYDVGSGGVMHPLGASRYVYARNLAANRQFDGPVLFLEPYFMNNRTVYQRIQAGDYEGFREFDGKQLPSIFREYADSVAAGLTNRGQTLNYLFLRQ